MCAIFGFIAHHTTHRRQSRLRLETLSKIVRGNIARGPHAFGFAWIDSDHRLHQFKQTGKLTDRIGALAMARDARVLAGHLRFATHGSAAENINNHPHPVDGGWLVHNGVVANYNQLVRDDRLWPVSECDSEILGLLIEQADGPFLLERCEESINRTAGNLAMLAVWPRPTRLIIARRGNPVHFAHTTEGIYFGSLAAGLPRKRVAAVPDGHCFLYESRPDGWRTRTVALAAPDASPALCGWERFDSTGEYQGG